MRILATAAAAAALMTSLAPAVLPPAQAQNRAPFSEEKRVETMSAPEAYRMASEGEMVLVDIRPSEAWAATGVPELAETLDFSDPNFYDILDILVEGDKSKPVGLICFTGGRTRYAAQELAKRGYTRAIDIAEGVRGSGAGPGWIARGLPMVQPN